MENITLRDYFAVECLKAIIISSTKDATRNIPRTSNGFPISREDYTKTAYQYADSMVSQRCGDEKCPKT